MSTSLELGVHRRYDGTYHMLKDVAVHDNELIVFLQPLCRGRTFVIPLNEFVGPAPQDSTNVTGQESNYEQVKDFSERLSTQQLLTDLRSREDCPVCLLENTDKIYLTQYVTGFENVFGIEGDHSFVVKNVFDTLEQAKADVLASNSSRTLILKRIWIKHDEVL